MARPKKHAIETQQTNAQSTLNTADLSRSEAETREIMIERLTKLYDRIQAEALEERRKTLLQWSHLAP